MQWRTSSMQWRTSSVAVALLAAAYAAPGTAADDVSIQAERRGDSVEIHARARIAAPHALVWEVLTDYERLPSFIPGLAKSVVRQRQGNRLVVEQTGEARFLVFSFPIDVRYEVIESPPDWISSRAVSGNLRRMNGRYDLQPGPIRAGAREVRDELLLRYEGAIEPDFELPPLIGLVALRSMVEQQFTAMVAEIERRAAAQGALK
jgi:ribosome-associated toxin RatA of RatAB toxin-antitoxin module